jgi:hypothetical protein
VTEIEKLMEALGIELGAREGNVRIGECPQCLAELHVHVPRQVIHCFGCGLSEAQLRRSKMRAVR